MRVSGLILVAVISLPAVLKAESKNPADYPLRVHVFKINETTFYHREVAEGSKGEGRANLFAGGEVHGVNFSFDCSEKVKSSFGFETYPAKWKKQGQELTVLMPVFGKTGSFFTCDLKTDVKDFAYASVKGSLQEEPSADFKQWMVRHGYDPEHGKDVPSKVVADGDAAKKD